MLAARYSLQYCCFETFQCRSGGEVPIYQTNAKSLVEPSNIRGAEILKWNATQHAYKYLQTQIECEVTSNRFLHGKQRTK